MFKAGDVVCWKDHAGEPRQEIVIEAVKADGHVVIPGYDGVHPGHFRLLRRFNPDPHVITGRFTYRTKVSHDAMTVEREITMDGGGRTVAELTAECFAALNGPMTTETTPKA